MVQPFGNVLHAVVILDMNTGQSRGFGFVHMDNAQSAAAAAGSLHSKMVEGRPLTVRLRSEGPGQRPADQRGPPPMRSQVVLFFFSSSPTLASIPCCLACDAQHHTIHFKSADAGIASAEQHSHDASCV